MAAVPQQSQLGPLRCAVMRGEAGNWLGDASIVSI